MQYCNKVGMDKPDIDKDLLENSQREQLALNLYNKMKTIGF